MNFRITTDSAADLSAQRMQELDVPFVQFIVSIDGEECNDNMSPEFDRKLYNAMYAAKTVSTTQVPVERFTELWEPLLQDGADILHLSFMSSLSGTYNSANLAKDLLAEKYPERTLMVMDSKCGCSGQGLLVEKAVELKQTGLSMDTLFSSIKELRLRVQHWFTLDTLTYLKRGGRISGTTALLAQMLHIKPIMVLTDECKLIANEKVRSRGAAIKRLIALISDKIDRAATTLITIAHADCLVEAEQLQQTIRAQYPKIKTAIYSAGGVVGAHVGPGTLAVFFIAKSDARLA